MAKETVARTLTIEDFRCLVSLAGDLHDEANRASEAECWRAAVFLLGSSIEAAILSMACACERELWSNTTPPSLLHWELGRLIKFAIQQNWLPVDPTIEKDAGRQDLFAWLGGDVGDAIQFLLTFRNMTVHPGRFITSEVVPDFNDVEQMKQTYDVLVGITRAVFEKLHLALASFPKALG